MTIFVPRKIEAFDRNMVGILNDNFRKLWWLLTGNIDFTNLGNMQAENEEQFFDEFGINPDFIKRFPNKIVNSGFERFPPGSNKPLFWVGDGVITDAANFDGTYALQLQPGQIMQQGILEDGLTPAGADPAWWEHHQTRVAFKHKGGAVRVSVHRYADDLAYVLVDNSNADEEIIGASIIYPRVNNWDEGLHTFYFQPQEDAGRVYVRFENVDPTEVAHIDAVQMEPDFTGKWPSFYTFGPRSFPLSDIASPVPATIIVAAADSRDKSRADFVCDGVRDDVELQQAADALVGKGGRIVLLEGNFRGNDMLWLPNNVTLEGQGWGTVLHDDGWWWQIDAWDPDTTTRRNIKVRNFRCGPGVWVWPGMGTGDGTVSEVEISGMFFDRTITWPIAFWTRDAHPDEDTPGDTPHSVGNLVIRNNVFYRPERGVDVNGVLEDSLLRNVIITNNQFIGTSTSVIVVECSNVVVAGNTFRYSTAPEDQYMSDLAAIYVDRCENSVVSNNTIEGYNRGIWVRRYTSPQNVPDPPSRYLSITGNAIQSCKREAIYVQAAVDSLFADNVITDASQESNNTYDAIHLTDSASNNVIRDNIVRSRTVAKPRYGINIAESDCTHNWITGNDLRSSGVSGEIGDSGTGTISNANLLDSGLEP